VAVQEQGKRAGWGQAAWLGLLSVSLTACGGGREVPIQQAKEGDLLVKAGQSRVELVRPFKPGVPNGLYRGAVRVSQPGGAAGGELHEVNAVCSIKGEPLWPTYDNLYGQPISERDQSGSATSSQRWQVLYHYDGKIETRGTASGNAAAQPWAARLKDNLCRRGDFDDRPSHLKDRT
jgi:hypothetical protein